MNIPLNNSRILSTLILTCILLFCMELRAKGYVDFHRNMDFNCGWKFLRCETANDTNDVFKAIDISDAGWEVVMLPHTPRIEPLVVNDQWQGICWYRKYFNIDEEYNDKKIFLEFEGAMQIAKVWINGRFKTTHYGGYLPFTIDITDDVHFDKENIISIRLDNRDNPDVPPGKALEVLDFCMYGGLYRNVKMHITDKLHITDAVYENRTGGGGIFVQYPAVSKEEAFVSVKTHIKNEYAVAEQFQIISKVMDNNENTVVAEKSDCIRLDRFSDSHITQQLHVRQPRLWHPYSPHLYMLHSMIMKNGVVVDSIHTRIGIRHIKFSASHGFQINGERFYLRGTNRHQEYPYIGYALSDNAHFRDAYKIKQAGFDYIRLSHYPHAPAFMDACDELGLVVMNCIPSWQFMGGDQFKQLCYQNSRDMVRRDRNHPCVILWEVSLNETQMGDEFLKKTHQITHAEYPGDQCYTCGWQDEYYDVFIQARQHGGCKSFNNGTKACIISEYGDWEYFAQNAGFNQPEFGNLLPEERNSRQLRGSGEKRLLQQALNFQEAHDDNLTTKAVGDGLWVMFDYNRGYDTNIEASGPMDIFRIPKFSYYFFRSQRKPVISKPMVYIANYWTENSPLKVRTFSNCDQLKLCLNGKELGEQGPDNDQFSQNLNYPPFTFHLDTFEAGKLEATGYINGKAAASHSVETPLSPVAILVKADCGYIKPMPGKKDVIFVYASVVDENGTVVPTASHSVNFELYGPGRLIGQNPMPAEAGIATILVETTGETGIVKIKAISSDLATSKELDIEIDSVLSEL